MMSRGFRGILVFFLCRLALVGLFTHRARFRAVLGVLRTGFGYALLLGIVTLNVGFSDLSSFDQSNKTRRRQALADFPHTLTKFVGANRELAAILIVVCLARLPYTGIDCVSAKSRNEDDSESDRSAQPT